MDATLILASGSQIRARLLEDAGVSLEVLPAAVDETAIRASMREAGAKPVDVADALADAKARRVAGRRPDRLVLGADQVLVCGDRYFDKPEDVDAARRQLLALRGRAHDLHSAAVAYEGGRPVWRHVGRATLTMRPFSDAFLDRYLRDHGGALTETLGGYRLEVGGAQLFERIQGDYFSILGLPLLEVLGFLRSRGVCLA